MIIQATGDPYYLDIGKTVIENLNDFARVSCGFAAIKDVKTNSHEDRSVRKSASSSVSDLSTYIQRKALTEAERPGVQVTAILSSRMDSFVLAETFKYLYLLFAEEEDLVLDMDEFIFNTEAHLFPLSLATFNSTLIMDQFSAAVRRLHHHYIM